MSQLRLLPLTSREVNDERARKQAEVRKAGPVKVKR